MLKRLTAGWLIFAILAANGSITLVYFGFIFNQSYIAAKLCTNRFRPSLHCNGKCYFMQKMRQAEQNEKKQSERDNSVRLEVSFCQEPFRITFIKPRILTDQPLVFPADTCFYHCRYKDNIFKPPPLA